MIAFFQRCWPLGGAKAEKLARQARLDVIMQKHMKARDEFNQRANETIEMYARPDKAAADV